MKLRQYVAPNKNEVFARYIFQRRDQHEGETLEKYIIELKLLIEPCEYHNPKKMTRDEIIFGIRILRIPETTGRKKQPTVKNIRK